MIRHRNCDSTIRELFAEDDVTTFLPDDREAVLLKNPAHLARDKEGNLGMNEFQSFYFHSSIKSSPDFGFVSFLEQQLDCFLKHRFGLFTSTPLAGDAKLRTSGDVPLAFFFDYRCQFRQSHAMSVVE
jgi:hypothetical protein